MCSPGTYSSNANSDSCAECLQGTYNSEFGATACALCPSGHFSADRILDALTHKEEAKTRRWLLVPSLPAYETVPLCVPSHGNNEQTYVFRLSRDF